MSFLDDAARAAQMQAQQQQVAIALLNVELRDRWAMHLFGHVMTKDWIEIPEKIRKAYAVADIAMRIRQEPPSEAPIPARP